MDNRKLIEKVARKLGRDKQDIARLLDAFTGIVAARCSELDTIAIPGFGNLEPRKQSEHIHYNPATGKRTLMPPKVTLTFKVSNVLKTKLKQKQPRQ
ncbi:MAG: HU family DNA-binding protein [Muribaculaceae bacterium]|nr:HU family DNA-binding protein [Muribaculaceae bacterium]MBR1474144.1 HU family DNA-binding protein [Muribaculaceae bacterium]MBR1725547.1 HU family DNA-binding protein [Muribaculaceae bacterium]